MADAGTISFSEAAVTALAASATNLTDAQEATIESIFGSGAEGPRVRLIKRMVYNRLVSDGTTVIDATGATVSLSSVNINAVPWAQLIQLLMTLLPTLIPLVCPPAPTPSLPPSGGA